MMPKLVKVNRNVSTAAAPMAGAATGNVTRQKVCQRSAPSEAAISACRSSSEAQKLPTMRTTTLKLKNTWASKMIPSVPVN